MTERSTRATLGFSLAMYAIMLGILLVDSLRFDQGHLVYLLDDTYIHIAMSKTLALHATWGVVPGVFESTSSSPAWTVLLAGLIKLVPPAMELFPLLLNLTAAVVILHLFATRQGFIRADAGGFVSVVAVALLPILLFLAPLTMVAMEHLWHTVVVLAILLLLRRLIEGTAGPREVGAYLGIFLIAPMVRYESLFLAGGCVVALLVGAGWGPPRPALSKYRRTAVTLAIVTLVVASVSVVLMGLVNLAHNQYLLPNSLVVKTQLSSVRTTISLLNPLVFLRKISADPMLALLFVAAAAYSVYGLVRRRRLALVVMAFVINAMGHVMFASIGWYERYQAYLVITGVFLMCLILEELVPAPRRKMALALALSLLIVVAAPTKLLLTIYTPAASNNIYRQQYQTANFLARYYDGRGVAINDMGLVALRHNGPLLDLFGLASHDVVVANRENRFDADFLRAETAKEHVEAIAIYTAFFEKTKPVEWVKVGSWTLDNAPGNLGYSTVDFWAPSAASAPELARDLRAYEPDLPAGVRADYSAPFG